MTPLKCSGLVTLVTISKTTKLETEFLSIPKGTDFATIEDHNRYVDYVLNRKALIVDVIFSFKFCNPYLSLILSVKQFTYASFIIIYLDKIVWRKSVKWSACSFYQHSFDSIPSSYRRKKRYKDPTSKIHL